MRVRVVVPTQFTGKFHSLAANVKAPFYRRSKEEVDVTLLITANPVNRFKTHSAKYYLYFFFPMHRRKRRANWGNEYSKFYSVILNKLFTLPSIDIVNLLAQLPMHLT